MTSRLRSFISSTFTGRRLQNIKRGLHEMKRRVSGRSHQVVYFHQIDDPYSHLLAQALAKVQSSYDIDLELRIVPAPADDAAPERAALEDYSRRDAAAIAPFYDLKFDNPGIQPTVDICQLAERALVASGNKVAAAVEIGAALWAGDSQTLSKMPLVSDTLAAEQREAGRREREALGHYLGGTLYYAGEWYWGIDRLPYLEERLIQTGLQRSGHRQVVYFQPRPAFMSRSTQQRLTLEYYPSIRSPYSYVSMPETLDLPSHYPVDLVVRPVLPMVMRGLPVPAVKRRYILLDTKREADRVGVPFGHIFDPVGDPVRRCYSLFAMADEVGKGGELLLAFCKMAWSEGIDVGSDQGIKIVVERAGLDWAAASEVIDNTDWEGPIEENRLQMMASGLWGVPSYRLLDDKGQEVFSCWGRDRIWLLAHEIQKALV
ncbi:MAG: DsbA family protein [Pseudomonadota bacterium]|nr:DsbA family protein [Pseudomonadota bacterium]